MSPLLRHDGGLSSEQTQAADRNNAAMLTMRFVHVTIEMSLRLFASCYEICESIIRSFDSDYTAFGL